MMGSHVPTADVVIACCNYTTLPVACCNYTTLHYNNCVCFRLRSSFIVVAVSTVPYISVRVSVYRIIAANSYAPISRDLDAIST
jgi:hypothetical protein